MNAASVSVVVIGRNEGARLERCLRSVQSMENPEMIREVIYVDSGSTDGSVAMAESFRARTITLRSDHPTAALGRNAGWKQASGKYILFLDGDTILQPGFVAELLTELEQQEVAVVWGHRREIDTAASFYNRVLDLDWLTPPGDVAFCGGDALMRRSVLEEVGGYDEKLIGGEEPDLCRRMRARGYRIMHVDRLMTGHDLAITRWSQYWQRATRTGYAYAQVSERYRNTVMPLWSSEARANRIRALALLALPFIAVQLSWFLMSAYPLLAAVGLLAMLVLRTAFKAKEKSAVWSTRLLYALHSHLQQIPIFVGQLRYFHDRRQGAERGLIEYKKA
jgi:glycosyltransferase involved in cell wall biosynthesis